MAPSRSLQTRWRSGFAALAALIVVVTSACSGDAKHRGADDPLIDQARAAAKKFLDTYVDADGRVSRHDQGDDTVSEGQSYALVLAQIAGDDAKFERVWAWTATHLRRPDGLLSSHALSNGQVDDPNAASDGDIVTAWALLRATGAAADAHHEDGRRLAAAVLDHETLTLGDGTLVLAAGNWATGTPATLNPSYWAIPAFTSLARLTSDSRWAQLADASIRLIAQQTNDGMRLPPDWERVDGTLVTPTPAPNRQVSEVRYSFDAQRVLPWLSAGGNQGAHLAAGFATLLNDNERERASALRTDGTIIDGNAHPVALVASAAAADSAGDAGLRDRRLAEAEALDSTQPTYYGSAWVALGRALLTTDLLQP